MNLTPASLIFAAARYLLALRGALQMLARPIITPRRLRDLAPRLRKLSQTVPPRRTPLRVVASVKFVTPAAASFPAS